ncbi:K+/H+ antiporter 1 [Hypoxylon trugodes]|uniref:K+/H+ antiporter 1 n=1 Tax=Hypoxylon trugodes TaxID=326681 RepID=UPI00219B98B7|nr:K+/H+ antiporter 1 [Hypoxylon trugodes]KAI1388006.1 K+/H+ antiporter 1 [Hypoxylon trugodes]
MATIAPTVTETLLSTVTVSSAPAATTTGPAPQGGILEGVLPNTFISSNPIQLFIIQAGIIIILCRILHYPLSLLNQPRVIAEVIGGILLGPSVLARIPGFQKAIFPTESMAVLNNAANLGLILFLFLIGLEVDIRMFTSNWRVALCVGLAGMILPFGLGCAIAWGLYNQFHNDGNTADINFGVYALFIGTALAITAFPVLCRILSELNMLGTPVGVTVLAAGVGNDVVGWILLALCVALVNNSSGLTALWVLLVAVGWVLFLVFAVKPVFHWALRKTGSIQNGPTQGMIAVTILLVLTSAWFTSMIGVHAIFGAFLVGLICPHDGGFAIHVTEKIEDLVSVLLLPLYFALSGLSTDLGLLNDGITWAYVIGVIAVAFSGKIIGGTLAAKAMKLVWRESFAIGALMSCKGLVELIVLNIGLQARILSKKTFTIFVVMALVTTVCTTPLTKWLYPPWYRKKLEQWKRGEIDWDGKPLQHDDTSHSDSIAQIQDTKIRRLLVYLRLDSLPSLFTFISLLGDEHVTPRSEPLDSGANKDAGETVVIRKRPLEVHGLRIVELTERTSSVMKVTGGDDHFRRDPVLNAFRTFSQLHDVAVSGNVVIAPEDSYARTVVTQASNQESDFVLVPWSEGGSNKEDQSISFRVSSEDRFSGKTHLEFIQTVLSKAVCTTGVFIDGGFSGNRPADEGRPSLPRTISNVSMRSQREAVIPPLADKSHKIFFPYLGGVDDRAALRFVLQLAKNPLITLTIAHLSCAEGDDEIVAVSEGNLDPLSPMSLDKNVINTEITAHDTSLLATLQSNLSPELADRVKFTEVSVTANSAVSEVTKLAKETVGKNLRNAGDVVVVGRRHPRLPAVLRSIDQSSTEYDMQKTIGVFGQALAMSDVKASVLVIQAGGSGPES